MNAVKLPREHPARGMYYNINSNRSKNLQMDYYFNFMSNEPKYEASREL